MSENRESNLNIINMSGDLSKSSIYKMTRSPKVQSVSKLEDGTVITVSEWMSYQDKNAKGEMVDIFAFTDTDANAYATQSETFIRQLLDIIDIFGLPVSITKMSGVTKAGREYVTCDYVDNK